ncbi:hypothetical protein LCGC14_0416000 [marine sediment metagenome]|uniref:SF3 helicase domain-containing protein n=1 Tax=marine sediment metagenome TaxID=412755 RepID=A0A0F9SYG5_9ZZZZ
MSQKPKAALADQHDTYRGNMFPGMFVLLSEQLGVSEESLVRLGLGYNPARNCWVFPERDATGEIVGLTYRAHDGSKFMEPGSKRGLTYAFNQDFEVGERRYSSGKHNWIRVAEAGVLCPVCGRPDWCLVSRDDPADPAAVTCTRNSGGSKRELKNGYLHILKDSGNLGGRGRVICDSELPVLIVEGQTDTAAALDMGFEAVGRPSAICNTSELEKVVNGKDVIIIGENDETVGIPGMEKTFINLEGKCKSVIKILPPDGSKDLRSWKNRFDLTADQFLEYVEEHGDKGVPSDILPDATGITIAKAWIQRERTVDGYPTVRSYKNTWVEFNDGKYKLVEKEILRGEVYRFLDDKFYVNETKQVKEIVPFKSSSRLVSDVLDALYYFGPITKDPPLWLKHNRSLPNPVDLIPFKNGILDVRKYLDGEIELYDTTPNLFTFTAIPYEFNPDQESSMWLDYLDDIFDGDEEKINLLQEWFGYNLVPDMSYEKLMMFIGRPRSGKGTVLHALSAMLGNEQVCSTSFKSLCGDFGYEPLIGKLAALLGDAKVPRSADSAQALEKILQITGADPVGVNRKGVRALPQVYLSCRFTMAMNLLPNLPDQANALEPRTNLIYFSNSYIGREDRTLKRRLQNEASAIVPWALEGLRRLRTTTEFTVPETSAKTMDDLRTMTTPAYSFVKECCVAEGENLVVQQDQVFDAWVVFCASRNMRAGFRPSFSQMLMSVCPNVMTDTIIDKNRSIPVYRGIELCEWVVKEVLGRP